jgi:DNA-binding transcriptional LysR family regulator
MNFTRLRYFIATAEEGSVVAAANRLRVAQPALSRQLHALEVEIGTPLFERHARGVRLLPAGVAFLDCARNLIRDAAAGAETARRTAKDASRTHLHVAPPDWLSRSGWVATAIAQLSAQCPHLTVQYRVIPWLRHADAVRDGLIDVGFGVGSSVADFGANVVAERLCDEAGSSAILPATHPLAARSSITLSDLRDLPALVPARDIAPLLHDLIVAMVRRGGYEPKVALAEDSFAATAQLVAVGAGWVLTFNSMKDVPLPGVVVVPISDAPVVVGFYALRRADAGDAPRALLATLQLVAQQSANNRRRVGDAVRYPTPAPVLPPPLPTHALSNSLPISGDTE